jgi:RNA polymerase sigma-70 factor (ECF subfamily)
VIEKQENSISGIVGHLFRHEAGKMAAVLTRKLGIAALDDVDDIVQDTLLRAMEAWKFKGIPENPTAWLHKVAWHRAIDYIRRKKREQSLSYGSRLDTEESESLPELADEKEIQDSVLRMMFACCHPSIPIESQIAFVLKTLGGLSVREIAGAFLTSEDTIAKRIYRAKEKIREGGIELDSPPVFEIPDRLEVILKVLYLLFNEGYYSSNPKHFIREDLCEESMRLTHLLMGNKYTNQPAVKALLALMCFQVSRFNARKDEQQHIILLANQDRSLWDRKLIDKGFQLMNESLVTDCLSEYHVEASIASIHAVANDFASTNWKELVHLYEILEEIKPNNFVSFNKAIALGYAHSPQNGIAALKQIDGLDLNQYYHSALGSFYLDVKDYPKAIDSFERAKELTVSIAEKELLNQRIEACRSLI